MRSDLNNFGAIDRINDIADTNNVYLFDLQDGII